MVCYRMRAHRLVIELSDVDLKRTRDPAVLDTCSIVVDVGGVYDESKQRFDHHQRGFQEVFGHGFNTKLSSAGLVYKCVYLRLSCCDSRYDCSVLPRHFGKEIIASRVHAKLEEEKVQTLWLKLYKEYIEAIDAIDNGVNLYDTDQQPKYRIRTDVSSRVGFLNPAWNEPFDSNTVDVSCVHKLCERIGLQQRY